MRQRVRGVMGLPADALLVCSVAVNSIRKDLARTIAAVREMQKLRQEATTDSITGLANARASLKRMEEENERARREDKPLALLFFDLNRFKAVNDTHGHEAGDKLIRAVVAGVRRSIKSSDVVARYGGDEFVCVFPGAAAAAAAGIGERIRSHIADTPLQIDGRNVPMSVSIGVAAYPRHGDNLETVARNADKALYLSKSGGRNRVTVYEEP